MKLLIITNLFPNAQEPNRAMFNKQQFGELSKLCELKIIAPIPYFSYSKKQVPEVEIIDGIEVYHPRYLVIPKILRCIHGFTYYLGVLHLVKRIYREFKFEAILASWAYPDIYAVSGIAQKLKLPFFAKVHGSDVNLAHQYFFRTQMIVKGLKRAKKVFAVSSVLKERMVKLGVNKDQIVLLPNGVDAKKFYIMDKNTCRQELGLPIDKKIVLYVGNMVPVKGVDVLIDAVEGLSSDICVVMIGEGVLRRQLELKVKQGKYSANVLFVGIKPHDEIAKWINAADVLCLPSRNEGCPNVILEALACKTTVVATKVGSIPEIISSDIYGKLVDSEDVRGLSKAIIEVAGRKTNVQFNNFPVCNWQDTAKMILKVL